MKFLEFKHEAALYYSFAAANDATAAGPSHPNREAVQESPEE